MVLAVTLPPIGFCNENVTLKCVHLSASVVMKLTMKQCTSDKCLHAFRVIRLLIASSTISFHLPSHSAVISRHRPLSTGRGSLNNIL